MGHVVSRQRLDAVFKMVSVCTSCHCRPGGKARGTVSSSSCHGEEMSHSFWPLLSGCLTFQSWKAHSGLIKNASHKTAGGVTLELLASDTRWDFSRCESVRQDEAQAQGYIWKIIRLSSGKMAHHAEINSNRLFTPICVSNEVCI